MESIVLVRCCNRPCCIIYTCRLVLDMIKCHDDLYGMAYILVDKVELVLPFMIWFNQLTVCYAIRCLLCSASCFTTEFNNLSYNCGCKSVVSPKALVLYHFISNINFVLCSESCLVIYFNDQSLSCECKYFISPKAHVLYYLISNFNNENVFLQFGSLITLLIWFRHFWSDQFMLLFLFFYTEGSKIWDSEERMAIFRSLPCKFNTWLLLCLSGLDP